jgi:hypothetical protein
MNPNRDPLEKLIGETLQGLPPRRAPRSLETRVLAELARRQALPWWKKSWANWPGAVRWTFLAFTAGLAAAMIAACIGLANTGSLSAVGETVSRPLAWASGLVSATRILVASVRGLFAEIPTLWLYGGLAAIGSLYATVFGLGATAYRLLWQTR